MFGTCGVIILGSMEVYFNFTPPLTYYEPDYFLDVSVETHLQEGSGNYFCRISGKIRANMLEVVAALLETDLYSSWIPLCTGCCPVKMINKQRAIITCNFDFIFAKKKCTISTLVIGIISC